ncbi:hypothetical protein ABN763_05410 [Spongiivirga sp. MCCC 1A20706]|uniref:hypothetical protein n=1 Tax=Spongiivirga sp. MCCC 1A20706 TaxID=3160963 RepID=UPI0039774A03
MLNLENIGLVASNGTTNINGVFNNLCVTVPAYNVSPEWYSHQLKIAWNMTTDQVFTYLNNTRGLMLLNVITLKALILEMFTVNLNFAFATPGGASALPTFCNGVPFVKAQYCE